MPCRHAVTGNTGTDYLTMIHRERRCPTRREFIMTELTFVAGQNMPAGLAAGIHAIMTVNTTVNDGTMIHTSRCPGCGSMTNITLSRGHHMPRWFTGGNGTVMTAGANAQHLCVVHDKHRTPGLRRRVMTILA